MASGLIAGAAQGLGQGMNELGTYGIQRRDKLADMQSAAQAELSKIERQYQIDSQLEKEKQAGRIDLEKLKAKQPHFVKRTVYNELGDRAGEVIDVFVGTEKVVSGTVDELAQQIPPSENKSFWQHLKEFFSGSEANATGPAPAAGDSKKPSAPTAKAPRAGSDQAQYTAPRKVAPPKPKKEDDEEKRKARTDFRSLWGE